jgi:hypothetical protein
MLHGCVAQLRKLVYDDRRGFNGLTIGRAGRELSESNTTELVSAV